MFAVTASRVFEGCGDHMGGGWWWVMGIGWLIFLAFIVGLAFVLARGYRSANGTRRSAHDTLDERFARGEIDEDEYRRRRETLRG
jgi:putative membrane protein